MGIFDIFKRNLIINCDIKKLNSKECDLVHINLPNASMSEAIEFREMVKKALEGHPKEKWMVVTTGEIEMIPIKKRKRK